MVKSDAHVQNSEHILENINWIQKNLSNLETIQAAGVLYMIEKFRKVLEYSYELPESDVLLIVGYLDRATSFCNRLIEVGINPVYLTAVSTEVIPGHSVRMIREQYTLQLSYQRLMTQLSNQPTVICEKCGIEIQIRKGRYVTPSGTFCPACASNREMSFLD